MHIAENYLFNWFFGLGFWTFRHRFDVGTMLRVFELNVKNPAFAKQKNSSMRRVFFEELLLGEINANRSYIKHMFALSMYIDQGFVAKSAMN